MNKITLSCAGLQRFDLKGGELQKMQFEQNMPIFTSLDGIFYKGTTSESYKDTDIETQHNRNLMLGNVYFAVGVRG